MNKDVAAFFWGNFEEFHPGHLLTDLLTHSVTVLTGKGYGVGKVRQSQPKPKINLAFLSIKHFFAQFGNSCNVL